MVENINEKEAAGILSSAYAMVYVPFYEREACEVIEAMKAEVPLIVSDIEIFKEYCAGAALYVEPEKINDIAEKMMLLFKDEDKRKELIENGRIQIKKFSHKENTTLLFNEIGRRILYVGNDQVPEIWEAPRPLFDFQIAKKLYNNKAEIKLNV